MTFAEIAGLYLLGVLAGAAIAHLFRPLRKSRAEMVAASILLWPLGIIGLLFLIGIALPLGWAFDTLSRWLQH